VDGVLFLIPDGDVDGGEIKASPPPPLAKENFDLDDDDVAVDGAGVLLGKSCNGDGASTTGVATVGFSTF
jgi:hypothetical protein